LRADVRTFWRRSGYVIATALVVASLFEAWVGHLVGERLREVVRRWPEAVDDPRRIESSLRRPEGVVRFLAGLAVIDLIGTQLPWSPIAAVAQPLLGLAFCGLMLRCMYVSCDSLLSRTMALIAVVWVGLHIALGPLGLDRWSLVIDAIPLAGLAMAMCRAILRIKR
jgi:hypothetical protein